MLDEICRQYEVKNQEAAWVCDFFRTAFINVMREQSSGLPAGMTTAAFERLGNYITIGKTRLASLDHPTGDFPATHPQPIIRDYSYVPDILADESGNVNNPDVLHIGTQLMQLVAEIAMSQSATLASGSIPADYKRWTTILDALSQTVDAIVKSADVDFPETAAPAATMQKPGAKTAVKR